MKRIGIDVGGTNTDAVLIEDARVRHAVKTVTTEDVLGGIRTALAELLTNASDAASGLDAVVIGTTHFANAVGAAIAQVSGEVDQVFSGVTRDAALTAARREAERRAVEAGAACSGLRVVEMKDILLSYLPGDARRVRVRVIGDIGDC